MGEGNDNDRHVVPNKERGGWDVVKEGHQRASAHLSTQKEAQDRARTIVENQGGGEIITHWRDGRIRDSDTKHGNESPKRDTK